MGKDGKDSGPSLRKRYPNRVPVICLGADSGADAPAKCKLLLPSQSSVAQFKKVILDRVPNAPVDQLHLGGELLQDPNELICDLDERLSAADGYLYATLGAPGPDSPAGSGRAQDQSPQGAAAAAEQFHLPDQDPEADMSVCGDSESVLSKGSVDVASKLLRKYPDRVPVLCRQAAKPGLPGVDKKLLVPRSMSCKDMKCVIRKHLDSPGSTAELWAQLHLFADGAQLQLEDPVTKVYDRHLGEDGLLRVAFGRDPAEALAQVAAADALRSGEPQEPLCDTAVDDSQPAQELDGAPADAGRHSDQDGLAAKLEAERDRAEEALGRARAECEELAREAAEREAANEARVLEAENQLQQRERELAEIADALRQADCAQGATVAEQVRSVVSELPRMRGRIDALQSEAAEREEAARARAEAAAQQQRENERLQSQSRTLQEHVDSLERALRESGDAAQASRRRAEAAEQAAAALERSLAQALRSQQEGAGAPSQPGERRPSAKAAGARPASGYPAKGSCTIADTEVADDWCHVQSSWKLAEGGELGELDG